MLPRRIVGHDGEPAYSAFARLALRHGVDNPRSFAADIGVSWSRAIANIDPAKVATLAGIDFERLARFTPKVEPRKRLVDLAGQKLLLNDWTVRYRRYCPHCFSDDRLATVGAGLPSEHGPWHRSWWDIRSYDACHVHHVAMKDRCPTCNAPLGWTRARIDRCRCGADLGASAAAPADPSVSNYIARRLGLVIGPTYPILEPLALHDSLAVLARLGCCASLGYRVQRLRASAKDREVARRDGLALARDWPAALESHLDRLVQRSDREMAPAGMIGAYGWIYSAWATTEAVEPFATELRRVLRDHAIAHDVVQAGEQLYGERFAQGGGITSAIRRLGSSYRKVRRAAEAGGVLGSGCRRGVATALPEAWIEDAIREAAETIDVQGVAAALCVGRARAREIINAGLLPRSPSSLGKKCYRVADVQTLLTSLRAAARVRFLSQSRGEERLPRACQISGVSIVDAIRAILVGRLAPCWIDESTLGLPSIGLRYEDLRSLRQKDNYLSVVDAARILYIHPDSVRSLVRNGYLAIREKTPQISKQSIVIFSSLYISNAEISQIYRISARRCVSILANEGVFPAIDLETLRNIIFARTQINFSHLKSVFITEPSHRSS